MNERERELKWISFHREGANMAAMIPSGEGGGSSSCVSCAYACVWEQSELTRGGMYGLVVEVVSWLLTCCG